jgi:hypothetical protein
LITVDVDLYADGGSTVTVAGDVQPLDVRLSLLAIPHVNEVLHAGTLAAAAVPTPADMAVWVAAEADVAGVVDVSPAIAPPVVQVCCCSKVECALRYRLDAI